MANENSQTAAATAAPAAAAPAQTAAPATSAPVAAAAEPKTLNDYAELARKDIAGEKPSPQAAAASPATEPETTGQEPSPEATGDESAQPSSQEVESPINADDDEPTADDMANWTDGEKRLHGALVKERNQNKEARAQMREMKAQLDELKKKVNPTQTQPDDAAASAPNPEPTPDVGPAMDDCMTFESVDNKAARATQTELIATKLMNTLNRNGVEAVVPGLLKEGVKEINGKPVAEADADEIGDYLAAVYEGAKITQAAAPIRKNWLGAYQQSLQDAVQLVPELKDANSPACNAAVKIVQQNPMLRKRPDWPVIVAKLWLGEQAVAARNKPAAAKPAAKPAPAKPAAKPAPGAPRNSVAAIPQTPRKDELAAKMANGTASMSEVQEYTRGYVAA